MTDQPKPDPQDGNELLPLDVRTQTTRYRFFLLLRAEASHSRLREEWNKLETLLDTPQPTPDATEGAEDFGDMPQAYLVAKTATPKPAPPIMRERFQYDPKPAPDAVREAVAEKIEKAWRWEHRTSRGNFTESLPTDEQALIFEALRSAPVPSPDGAGIEDALTKLMDDAWPDGHREMARKIISQFTLSPPGTGAEPVAWQYREKIPGSIWRHCDIVREDISLEYRQLYATPPVRGDREAIAWTLYECEKRRAERAQEVFEAIGGRPCPGAGTETWDESKGAFLSDADTLIAAGLVLPVQPGAGEREAIIRECAEKVQSYLGAATESKRFGDEAYAMLAKFSHQPPHSSSDKDK